MASLVFLLIIFNQEFIASLSFNTAVKKYLEIQTYVDQNIYLLAFLYFIISIFWISFLGIASPMLVLSTLMFGYFGSMISILSFTVGSVISFNFAKNFKHLIKNYLKNIHVKENPFFLYVIFRFIPGFPLIIRNFSGVFFNLSNKQFVCATLISESPQIILFTFILQRLLESSEILLTDFNISTLSERLILPILLMLGFLTIIFILKVKFGKYFLEK